MKSPRRQQKFSLSRHGARRIPPRRTVHRQHRQTECPEHRHSLDRHRSRGSNLRLCSPKSSTGTLSSHRYGRLASIGPKARSRSLPLRSQSTPSPLDCIEILTAAATVMTSDPYSDSRRDIEIGYIWHVSHPYSALPTCFCSSPPLLGCGASAVPGPSKWPESMSIALLNSVFHTPIAYVMSGGGVFDCCATYFRRLMCSRSIDHWIRSYCQRSRHS